MKYMGEDVDKTVFLDSDRHLAILINRNIFKLGRDINCDVFLVYIAIVLCVCLWVKEEMK